MEQKKLIIKDRKYRGEKTVISSRLPVELIAVLDDIAASTGRTRNDIIQKCLEFAVENIVYDESSTIE